MTCAGCNLIESSPVTLNDGTTVCSSCEAWRIETFERHKEAKRISALNGLPARQQEIARYEANHGAVAVDRLKATIKQMWGTK